MTGSSTATAPVDDTLAAHPYALTPHQLAFFETFGFLRLPGLFADDIDRITEAFESVFAAKAFLQIVAAATGTVLPTAMPTGDQESDPPWFETNFDLHFGRDRVTIPAITSRDDRLTALEEDPRITGAISSILGPEFVTKPADGNLFYCDTSWHADVYGSPLDRLHVKMSLYLDPLDGDSGAIRLLPGTNFYDSAYAEQLRGMLWSPETIAAQLGIAPDEIPSFTLVSEPGDAVLWNFRIIHAAFNGRDRRRLLSFNFSEVPPTST